MAALTMALARLLGRWWWVAAAPAWAGLALLATWASRLLIPDTRPARDAELVAEARRLADAVGAPPTAVEIYEAGPGARDVNAVAAGFGATRRVVLWDTLLESRFSGAQVRTVLAHELAHVAHGHALKSVGWLALLALPAAATAAWATRRRGGLARPEAVPLALLTVAAWLAATQPASNALSRRMELEADWTALQATREPAAARALFRTLALRSRSDPDPPRWAQVLTATHPTFVQRIALTRVWERRHHAAGP